MDPFKSRRDDVHVKGLGMRKSDSGPFVTRNQGEEHNHLKGGAAVAEWTPKLCQT